MSGPLSGWPSGTSTPSILPPEMIETQPHERPDNPRHIRQQTANNTRMGLELSKSSGVKRRKLRSDVWKDFEKYKDEDGKDWAKCKVCEKVFDGSSKLGTTHLKNHFKSCRRKRNGGWGGDEPAQLAGSLSNPIAIQEKSVMEQQLNHLDVAQRIIKQGDASLINSTNVGNIIDVYKEEKAKLRNYFEKLSCRFCLTFYDSAFEDYSCLMVWFINEDWKLKKRIIGFKLFENETVMKDIKSMLLEWGIANNLSSMVIDSGRDCDFYMLSCNEREDWFSNHGSIFLNNKLLCTETFFSDVDETNYYFLVRVVGYSLCEGLDRLFNSIRETSSENENFRNAIDAAVKSLGKEVTAQVVFPSGQELWEKFSSGEESNLLGLLKNVFRLKETFFELENSHPHFQNLTKEEWDVVRATYECYEYFSDVDLFMQYCSNYNTANTHFPRLCRMHKCLKELRKCDIINRHNDLIERADNDWYEYNLVLAVASVLDPRFKMDIVRNWYKNIFEDEWETEFTKFTDYFTNIYNEYARQINNFKSCSSASEETNSSISYKMLDPLGKSYKPFRELNHVQTLNLELHLYLEEIRFPSFQDFDILEWWRLHARYFPTLARMARDFLSIQISCHPFRVSYEEMDSIVDLDIEEAYICTKSWLSEEL